MPARPAAFSARLLPVLLLAAGTLLGACSARGADTGITREQGDAILKELREIRRLLAEGTGQPEKAAGDVDVADNLHQSLGAPGARVTLVEFTDYQCPFCKRFHDRSWPEIKAKYIDTGKVRYVVRDMPLNFHAQAMPAAIAARCAAEQGQFWPVHDALFNSQEALTAAMARQVALGHGVAAAPFDACVANPATHKAVAADVAEAEHIGVTGTPGFVIAQKSGERLRGTLVLGAQPTEVFTSRFDELLAAHPAP